jgi:hypothetical protein
MVRAIPAPIIGGHKQSKGRPNPEEVYHPPTHLGDRRPEAPAPFRYTSGGWETGKIPRVPIFTVVETSKMPTV